MAKVPRFGPQPAPGVTPSPRLGVQITPQDFGADVADVLSKTGRSAIAIAEDARRSANQSELERLKTEFLVGEGDIIRGLTDLKLEAAAGGLPSAQKSYDDLIGNTSEQAIDEEVRDKLGLFMGRQRVSFIDISQSHVGQESESAKDVRLNALLQESQDSAVLGYNFPAKWIPAMNDQVIALRNRLSEPSKGVPEEEIDRRVKALHALNIGNVIDEAINKKNTVLAQQYLDNPNFKNFLGSERVVQLQQKINTFDITLRSQEEALDITDVFVRTGILDDKSLEDAKDTAAERHEGAMLDATTRRIESIFSSKRKVKLIDDKIFLDDISAQLKQAQSTDDAFLILENPKLLEFDPAIRKGLEDYSLKVFKARETTRAPRLKITPLEESKIEHDLRIQVDVEKRISNNDKDQVGISLTQLQAQMGALDGFEVGQIQKMETYFRDSGNAGHITQTMVNDSMKTQGIFGKNADYKARVYKEVINLLPVGNDLTTAKGQKDFALAIREVALREGIVQARNFRGQIITVETTLLESLEEGTDEFFRPTLSKDETRNLRKEILRRGGTFTGMTGTIRTDDPFAVLEIDDERALIGLAEFGIDVESDLQIQGAEARRRIQRTIAQATGRQVDQIRINAEFAKNSAQSRAKRTLEVAMEKPSELSLAQTEIGPQSLRNDLQAATQVLVNPEPPKWLEDALRHTGQLDRWQRNLPRDREARAAAILDMGNKLINAVDTNGTDGTNGTQFF